MEPIKTHAAVSRPFIDPVKGVERELVVSIGPPAFEALHVEHGCSDLGDVSADLDAWFCPVCHAQGRISGAWALDVYAEITREQYLWEGEPMTGLCGHCQIQVDSTDPNHRVTSIVRDGRGVECVLRGDITAAEGGPLRG